MSEIRAETIERSFSVGLEPELSLNNVTGAVSIRTWDRREIHIVATKRQPGFVPWGTAEESFAATKIDIDQEGDRVIAKTTQVRDGLWALVQWLGGVAPVDYDVMVPYVCNVVIDLVNGKLQIEDLNGNVTTRVVSARTTLSRLNGAISAQTVSGSVEARRISGTVSLRGVSGSLRAIESFLEEVNVQTVSGSVEIETPLTPEGSYTFGSVSGTVRLVLPPGAGLSAELSSINGSIRSEIPGFVEEIKRGQWRAQIGADGPKVQVKSVSGGLRLIQGQSYERDYPSATERARADTIRQTAASQPPKDAPAPETPLTQQPFAPPPSPPSLAEEPQTAAPMPEYEPKGIDPHEREALRRMILEAVRQGKLSIDEAAQKLRELDELSGD